MYLGNSSWNVKDALLLAAASVGMRGVAAGGSVGAGTLTIVVVGRAVVVGVIIAPVGVGVCCPRWRGMRMGRAVRERSKRINK